MVASVILKYQIRSCHSSTQNLISLRVKVKVKVLTLIQPQITSGFLFYSLSLPHLLFNSLSAFNYLLKCSLVAEVYHSSTQYTQILNSRSPPFILSFFVSNMPNICLFIMFIAYPLSPLECELHKGRDVYLISSLMYLGNEKSAWSRGDN